MTEFNIGDRVWLVDVYGELTDGEGIAIESDVVTGIYVDGNDPSDETLYQTNYTTFWESSVGRIAFKTEEAAKARVKELENYHGLQIL